MMVKVENLKKNFSDKRVLNGISFEVKKGEIFSLIGPNGAGKTTTLRCVYGSLKPNGGKIEIFDEPFNEKLKEKIAVMNENRRVFKRFTGGDYVKIWSLLYPQWNDEIFSNFAIHYKFDLNQRVETYSIGMKTIFYIALTFASGADLLILDEPTQHLDPLIRAEVLKIISDYANEEKKTILISSHEIYELEEISTSFGIIKEGKIIYQDNVDDAKASHRLISQNEKVSQSEIVGFVGNEILVKTNKDIGRYPTFKEIVIGYLGGKEEFTPFK
ncbi:ABC transporter ATP-binding protein [Mesoaciditoga lauensis]|uniref:ABC transporter ATP-binding protein n=1 Tax=Mesoaciditoga lauensis TaxID=1495039 RepID=UPI00055F72FF|nr:ABC transporter ATP-binding protein [Mesoaciditoga lauensis]